MEIKKGHACLYVTRYVCQYSYLRENKHSVSTFLEFPKHLLQQIQFSSSFGQSSAFVHAIGHLWSFLFGETHQKFNTTSCSTLQFKSSNVNIIGVCQDDSALHYGSYHCSCREQVRVVAAFLEVHYNVEQGYLIATSTGVQGLKVTSQNELVVFPAETEYMLNNFPTNNIHSTDMDMEWILTW